CLEVNKDFGDWLVVANTVFSINNLTYIDFSELGLDPVGEYIVYDFWKEELVGVYSQGFNCSPPNHHDIDVYSIHKNRGCPWVVSIDRHISQGGISLENLNYDDSAKKLTGTIRVVPGDDYVLHIYYPEKFQYKHISLSSGIYDIKTNQSNMIDLTILSTDDALITWSISFKENDTGIFSPKSKKKKEIIDKFQLFQSYPNPFNAKTIIKYRIAEKGFICLRLYNIRGELVRVLLQQELYPGIYSHEIDCYNLESGIHFISLIHDHSRVNKKIILMK
ncbi:MAG: T9SS type A sorting domain-containing protein, partial [Candidatus Marinimicrobia bacterium]|nr:T9SS type A sorting domain-containing protein [Candidatus Neomarinimicrobiota bacterium]